MFIRPAGLSMTGKGKAILNNTILYDLMVTPSQVKNIDTGYFCQLMEIDTAEFRRRMLDAKDKKRPFRPSFSKTCSRPICMPRWKRISGNFPASTSRNVLSGFIRLMPRRISWVMSVKWIRNFAPVQLLLPAGRLCRPERAGTIL